MKRISPHQQGLAAVLSFFCPGLGQIYKGQIVRGFIYFMLVIALYYSLIFIPFGIALHCLVVFGAYYHHKKVQKYLVDPKRFNSLDDI